MTPKEYEDKINRLAKDISDLESEIEVLNHINYLDHNEMIQCSKELKEVKSRAQQYAETIAMIELITGISFERSSVGNQLELLDYLKGFRHVT